MKLEGKTAASRRIKAYAVELNVPDIIFIYEDDELDIQEDRRIMLAPALGHGPEDAIKRIEGDENERVESIRRIKNAGLLRAMLTPEDEEYDYNRGQMEESLEEVIPDE